MRNPRVRLIIAGLAWLIGLLALAFLPNPSPIHWNAVGQPDGYGSPLAAAFLLPAILTAIVGGAAVLPRLDPRSENYAAFRPTYELFMNTIAVFLLLLHFLAIGSALNLVTNMARPLTSGLGLMFAVLGNEMGRVQPNYFVGIRTPWTLADPEVWRRTHRVGGRAMAGAGLAAALLALILPLPWVFGVVMGLILGAALFSVVYSYLVHRGRGAAHPQG